MLATLTALRLATALLAHPAPDTATTFVERRVTIGSGEWAIAGVLTLPATAGPHPAALLLHGSGPGPAERLRDRAEGLARRGVASLRYTKRSTAHAEKFRALGRRATIAEEHLDDALLGVALLRQVAGIDSARIYVVGWSQSTLVAPVVAERMPSVAGIALIAASARPAADLIEEQVRYVSSLSPGDTAAQRDAQHMLGEVARMRDPATADTALVLGLPMAYWRDTTTTDVQARVRRILDGGRPVLVIHGGRDYLVTDADFAAWQRNFAGVRGITLQRFANLNHMMQAGEGRMHPDEYRERRPLAPEFVDALARWIREAAS